MDAHKFGSFIAGIRKERNLTQAELASKIQVTDKAVSRWERGLGFPDINTLEPLAEALGISFLELMKCEKVETQEIKCEDVTCILKDTIQEADNQRLLKGKQNKKILAGVLLLLLVVCTLLVAVLLKNRYVVLAHCSDSVQVSRIESILDAEGIPYKVATDGLIIKVLDKQRANANLCLGAHNIRADAYLTNYEFEIEKRLSKDIICNYNEIKNASVNIYCPPEYEAKPEPDIDKSVHVLLELQSEFTADDAKHLAHIVAGAIGNKSSNSIVIVDVDGNILYSGENYSGCYISFENACLYYFTNICCNTLDVRGNYYECRI